MVTLPSGLTRISAPLAWLPTLAALFAVLAALAPRTVSRVIALECGRVLGVGTLAKLLAIS